MLLYVLNSCENATIDNDTETEEPEEDVTAENRYGSLTATVNGEEFKTPDLEDFVGAEIDVSDGFFSISIVGADIRLGLNRVQAITLAILGPDFDSVQEGSTYTKQFDGLSLDEAAFGIYAQNIAGEDGQDEGEGTVSQEIFIKILKLDENLKRISGEFNFRGTDEETGNSYNVTDGVFSNVPYK